MPSHGVTNNDVMQFFILYGKINDFKKPASKLWIRNISALALA